MRFLAAFLALFVAITAPAQAQRQRTVWVNVVAKTPEGGVRQGNPNAAIKVVEYGSRTCPTCGLFAAEGVEPLRRDWIASGKASYEFRDLLVHGAPDLALALLNQCVPTARFFPTLDAMFANQQAFDGPLHQMPPAEFETLSSLPPAQAATRFAEKLGMLTFMRARGLPEAQARRCLADPALIRMIANGQASGVKAGVNSTPSFFVNGRRVRASSWDQLQPELRAVGG